METKNSANFMEQIVLNEILIRSAIYLHKRRITYHGNIRKHRRHVRLQVKVVREREQKCIYALEKEKEKIDNPGPACSKHRLIITVK